MSDAPTAPATPYHDMLGLRVESVTAESARIRIPYRDENSNPGKALHGGVAASAIDVTAGLLARAVHPGALDFSFARNGSFLVRARLDVAPTP